MPETAYRKLYDKEARLKLSESQHPSRPTCPSGFGCLMADLHWLVRAALLPGRTLHLALALRLIALSQHTLQVQLGNIAALQFGLDRNAKYRALACLEAAGLVTVSRKLGRSPTVTILPIDKGR